ncbi:MAG: GNAT family N-acetyltransferase [Planctomycetaceae bacterium]
MSGLPVLDRPTTSRPLPRSEQPTLSFRTLPASARSEVLRAWEQLEHQWSAASSSTSASTSPAVPLTCSVPWVRAWLANYGDEVPHEFFVAERGGRTVGITLLTRGVGHKDGPFRVQTRHLGTAGERPGQSVCTEYNRVLCLPADRAGFEDALFSHLLGDKSWEQLCLDGFTAEDAARLLQDLPGAELRRRESPYYNLAATRMTGGELLDPLGRSTRQNVRRLLRKHGELTTEWATDLATAQSILHELIELHQARWQAIGEPGAFKQPRFRGFQEQLVRDAFDSEASNGRARSIVLCRVRNPQQTVGCLMLLVDGRRLLDYLSGFADFNAVASPGIVTHVCGMEEALQRGYDAYDFLVGEKRHKANLSTDTGELVWATWSRPSLKSRTVDTLRSLKRRWRNFREKPQSPPLPDENA